MSPKKILGTPISRSAPLLRPPTRLILAGTLVRVSHLSAVFFVLVFLLLLLLVLVTLRSQN